MEYHVALPFLIIILLSFKDMRIWMQILQFLIAV